MRKYLHIIVLLALALTSCRGPRLIPKNELAEIYYEMFLTDQIIQGNPELRRQADTTLVYESVFNRHGYDTDDYLYTLKVYLKDPERFATILEGVAKRFTDEASLLKPAIEHLDWMAEYLNMKRPPLDSLLLPFSEDSLVVGLARVARDSSRYGGWFRLVPVQEDTLMVPIDTTDASTPVAK